MSSTHKTDLGFNKWVLSDKPTMYDFNADNALTDELLNDHKQKLDFLDEHTENIRHMPVILTGEVFIAVGKNGDDASGDGSPEKPYLTIGRAMQEVCRMYGPGCRVTLHIGAGTYAEQINFSNSCIASLVMAGAGIDETVITWDAGHTLMAEFGALLSVRDMTIGGAPSGGNAVTAARYNAMLIAQNVKINRIGGTGNGSGFNVGEGARGRIFNSEINNTSDAVVCGYAGQVFAYDLRGTGNGNGYNSCGGIIHRSGSVPSAGRLEMSTYGGHIFS